MPIQFRCTNCRQKLSISRRKAGKIVACPACAKDLLVPTLDEAAFTGQLIESSPSEEPVAEKHLSDPSPPAPGKPGIAPDITAAVSNRHHHVAEEDDDEEDGFHLGRRSPDESGLDMTPMVDVTFLLLIFFMITASFSVQKSMEAEPPKPEQEGAAQLPSMEDLADDSVIVEIDENNIIYVDDAQVGSIPELIDVLALKVSGEGKLEMIIEPHPLSKHGTVVQVTDAGIDVGMQRIRRVIRKGD